MQAESRLFLAKARESVASAEADLQAGRVNSAVNRAYYAAFQAGIAVLINEAIGPRGDAWDHRFVISQISGKLITRRKVMPPKLTGVLDTLLQRRLRADYRPAAVSKREARDSVAKAKDFLKSVTEKLKG